MNIVEKPHLHKTDVMGSILSVANGWGEESTFYKVGGYYETVKIAKIQQETKVLGAGYYNDLTINCYVGYSSDGKKLFEINDVVPDKIEPLKPWGDYDTHIIAMASDEYPEVCFSSIVHKASFFLIFRRLETIASGAGTTLAECLELAYDEIKDRKGKMIKGVYIKEGDL